MSRNAPPKETVGGALRDIPRKRLRRRLSTGLLHAKTMDHFGEKSQSKHGKTSREFPHPATGLGLLMTRHTIMITIRRSSKAAIITVHHMVLKNPPEKEMKCDKHCIDIERTSILAKIWTSRNHSDKDVKHLNNSSFARFVRVFIIVPFSVVLVQSTTLNHLHRPIFF